jgi:prevent-host-death family protein
MQTFRSQDMQKQAAAVQEAAMKEPVIITYHDRPRLVVMSMEEFDRLRSLPGAARPQPGPPAVPNKTERDFLIAYFRSELTRNEAMDGIGLDRSEVAEFARLMNTNKIPWPKADRQQAEREADGLMAMLDVEIA